MTLLLFIATVAAAQAAPAAPSVPTPAVATLEERYGRSFMSPMGEPFFGRTPGEDGLTAWFRQTDLNHDGFVTVDEMKADAQQFFDTLDSDHDGEIGPDEITHYEDVIAPQVGNPSFHGAQPIAAAASDQSVPKGRRGGKRHHGGFRGGFGGDDEASAGRYGLLQIPEPVMSADADFNRGVSAAEFGNAAAQRFQLLDVSHTGRLTLPELQNIRGAAAAASRRPPVDKSEDQAPMDANADSGGPGM
jgi:Ca2+-binding EF-hand superfamily protein